MNWNPPDVHKDATDVYYEDLNDMYKCHWYFSSIATLIEYINDDDYE